MKAFLVLLALVSLPSFAAVKISATIKGSTAEVARIQKILPHLEAIINSEEFQKQVTRATYTLPSAKASDVYTKIQAKDWSMSFAFAMQRNWRGKCPVLGWTYPNVKTVWFNTCNFAPRTDAGIAGTIAHEQLHQLGFTHNSATSYQSVPYSIGNLVSELYEKSKF